MPTPSMAIVSVSSSLLTLFQDDSAILLAIQRVHAPNITLSAVFTRLWLIMRIYSVLCHYVKNSVIVWHYCQLPNAFQSKPDPRPGADALDYADRCGCGWQCVRSKEYRTASAGRTAGTVRAC